MQIKESENQPTANRKSVRYGRGSQEYIFFGGGGGVKLKLQTISL